VAPCGNGARPCRDTAAAGGGGPRRSGPARVVHRLCCDRARAGPFHGPARRDCGCTGFCPGKQGKARRLRCVCRGRRPNGRAWCGRRALDRVRFQTRRSVLPAWRASAGCRQGDAFLVGGDLAPVFAECLRARDKIARIDPGAALPDARTVALLAESAAATGALVPLYIHPPATTTQKAP